MRENESGKIIDNTDLDTFLIHLWNIVYCGWVELRLR